MGPPFAAETAALRAKRKIMFAQPLFPVFAEF
jgi:hypothetical protein